MAFIKYGDAELVDVVKQDILTCYRRIKKEGIELQNGFIFQFSFEERLMEPNHWGGADEIDILIHPFCENLEYGYFLLI